MNPGERWNDDRLDDLARQVQRNIARLDEYTAIREELVEVRGRLANVSGDAHDCIVELRAFKQQAEERARLEEEAQKRRDKAQRDERKADRKWMVATLLATATLIVGALAVFIG